MDHAAEVGCPEFAVTWVRSGQWISFGGVVPDAVLDAPPVPGFHQVHIDTTVIDQGAATAILRDEALDLLSRMVHVPHGLAAGVAPAMARADQVGLPTLAQAPESWDPRDPRLVPFDAHGEVDAVLVLPTEHLVDERYRLTEQWAIEQLGSSDPQAARRLRRQRDAARSLRSWHPLDTDTSPSAYLATLRERTARLIELVRHHDASLTPPGRLRPGSTTRSSPNEWTRSTLSERSSGTLAPTDSPPQVYLHPASLRSRPGRTACARLRICPNGTPLLPRWSRTSRWTSPPSSAGLGFGDPH